MFKKGVEYLVYAYARQDAPGTYHTGLCMRNKPLADAKADLAALGKGKAVNVRARK